MINFGYMLKSSCREPILFLFFIPSLSEARISHDAGRFEILRLYIIRMWPGTRKDHRSHTAPSLRIGANTHPRLFFLLLYAQ